MTHLRENLRSEVSTVRCEGFGDTCSDWYGQSLVYVSSVADQSRGSLLFLIPGEVGKFASMIQVTHIFTSFPWSCEPSTSSKISYPIQERGRKWEHRRIHELDEFSQGPLTSVPELTAVLYGAARLRIWIPNTSRPRPHVDPARRGVSRNSIVWARQCRNAAREPLPRGLFHQVRIWITDTKGLTEHRF